MTTRLFTAKYKDRITYTDIISAKYPFTVLPNITNRTYNCRPQINLTLHLLI